METSHEKMNESIVSNDLSVEALLAQIVELKNENQKATEEFGAQRAKLKELFLQREDELRKLRDEINVLRKELDSSRMEVTEARLDLESKEIEGVKNVEELSSLFQLLNSTLEESSRLKEEITKLKGHNEELETLLLNVKSANQNSSVVGDLNLVNPGTMFTTLARKVKSQLGAADLVPHQVESLEENMRKAKEDAEVMKSLVLPLEEEIRALKTKLRETDEQLQKYQKEEASENVKLVDLGSPTEAKKNCVMCSNYETNLVQEQAKIEDLERQLAVMNKSKEELDKGIVFRKQLEEKWAESKEEHKTQVAELQGVIKELEGDLINLRKSFTKSSEKLKRDFKDLIEERRATEEKLNRLQLENEILVGKHSASATELQNEKINLPDSVEKLHEIWLTQREQLIAARVGQERSEENVKSLERLYKDTMDKVREQSQEINQLKRDLDQSHKETLHEKHLLQTSLQENTTLSQKSAWLESQVEHLEEDKKKLEKSEGELRNRLSSLQMGLENGEAVQKDFVMLSQSLQKELERLRSQNNTLRWEHEEDVHACNGCEQPFKSKKKINCKHCGRIFCNACLSHKVTSGPNQRESKVCQVCHTLLNSETAPYFSTEPPK